MTSHAHTYNTISSRIISIIKGKQLALQLEDLPANMYFVLIQNKYGYVATKKIVIGNN
jgi:hypothetical protein